MVAIRLTQRRVDTIRPRKTVRNVRDAGLKGYGVRIMPSGVKRYFIHGQHRGHRVWKVIGDAAVLTEAEARARARSMLAALRDDRDIEAEVSGDALFEAVAEEVFARYGRRWKPRTLVVNGRYLRNQILPFFEGRPIAGITREEVQRWFRSLHATPSAANRSAPILSVIMQQAEAWGYRPDGSNPCKGIRRCFIWRTTLIYSALVRNSMKRKALGLLEAIVSTVGLVSGCLYMKARWYRHSTIEPLILR